MATTNKTKIDTAIDTLEELDRLLTERISELHLKTSQNIALYQSERHAFVLYRNIVWQAKHELQGKID